MRLIIMITLLSGISWFLSAQETEDTARLSDTLLFHRIDEIVVISSASENHLKEGKSLGSVDSYLERSNAVNMIRRGAYAWEPMLHGMATERSIITIDGMRIYHACTDKMDPVTSYVENTNLSSAKIQEGQTGAKFGGTIAGSIDLIRRKTGYSGEQDIGGSVFAGYEGNNQQQIYGTTLSLSDQRYFADIDFTFRDAANYRAGHRSDEKAEVDFSQFTKYNASSVAGYRLSQNQEVTASFIFDKATDVGYPGLPMDVSLAQAVIAALEYKYTDISEHLDTWETKAYFNRITHVMDDSQRPIVPIRMDMPGWSNTSGFYSKLNGEFSKHRFDIHLSGHQNNSLAEMTMYPNDPEEKEMFMLTWPDVNTTYAGLHLEDRIYFKSYFSLDISAGIGVHRNRIRSSSGLSSLRLFYPDMTDAKTRFLKNVSSRVNLRHGILTHEISLGYGERSPSVSEGYGFYLLNANDNYDYVGNPNMKNEKSANVGISSTLLSSNLKVGLSANYFHIIDYIIGKPSEGLPPMNITADGIKVYEQLNHATMISTGMDIDFYFNKNWILSADASYRYGQGGDGSRLPLIQPFSYGVKLGFEGKQFFGDIKIRGNSKTRNSIEFGETKKPSFMVVDLSFSKEVSIGNQELILKTGVENLLDRYYISFEDWLDIPRMGRNVFGNIIFRF